MRMLNMTGLFVPPLHLMAKRLSREVQDPGGDLVRPAWV